MERIDPIEFTRDSYKQMLDDYISRPDVEMSEEVLSAADLITFLESYFSDLKRVTKDDELIASITRDINPMSKVMKVLGISSNRQCLGYYFYVLDEAIAMAFVLRLEKDQNKNDIVLISKKDDDPDYLYLHEEDDPILQDVSQKIVSLHYDEIMDYLTTVSSYRDFLEPSNRFAAHVVEQDTPVGDISITYCND